MKKLFVLLSILLLLCGCTKKEEEIENFDPNTLTVVTPKGAPVLAFYSWIPNENYSRVAADAIGALWTGEE